MAKKKKADPIIFQLFEPVPRKGDLRKIEIIRSAVRIIAKEGIDNISYDSIGKPLGIGRAHVAYYFKDKNEIIANAIKYVIAEGQALIIEQIKDAVTPKETLTALIEAYFDWATTDPQGFSVYILFFYYSVINKSFHNMHVQIKQAGTDRIQSVLELDQALAQKYSRQEMQELAHTVQSTTIGALFYLITTSELSKEEIGKAKKSTVKAVLKLVG